MTVLGEATDYAALHGLLRARREALGLSYAVLDDISGLSYSDQLLAPLPCGQARGADGRRAHARHIGPVALGPLLSGLGVKLVLEVDAAAEARLRRHAKYGVRAESCVRRRGNTWSASIDELIRHRVARKLGDWGKLQRQGGLNRARALSPERRQAIARDAARARWGKRRPVSEDVSA